jgi:membrane protease YdiL (CAAX protease family)
MGPRSLPDRAREPAWGSLVVVAVLVAANLLNHALGWSTLWLGPLVAAALLVLARWWGLRWNELGLARANLGPGLLWGGLAAGGLAVAYLVVALVPATRPVFVDDRYDYSVAGALLSAFVVIPIGTVVYEEIAFRSVLWGFLGRRMTSRGVLLTTSALFGLWHVFPAVGYGAHNEGVGDAADALGPVATAAIVVGTVLFTGAGGLVFGWLRQRSGSVVASMLLHWVTNGLGVLVGLLVRALGT